MKANVGKWYPWILLSGSSVGLVASVWQAAERVQMLKEPAQALACNLNPVIDCGSVLANRWSSLFGFPNAFIGIAIFAMLFMASLLLVSGGKPTQFFTRSLLSISTILILFSLWFFSMSLYVIGKVCLFCIFIWAVSVPIYWYGLLHHWNVHQPKSNWLRKFHAFGTIHHMEALVLVYILMLALFLFRFRGYYFGS